MNIREMLFGSKNDFRALMKEGAIVIDVRTPDEYRSGHVAGSLNIPLDLVASKINEIKAKEKTIITVCRSGARSAAVAGMLKKAGVKVYNGGGWSGFERAIN